MSRKKIVATDLHMHVTSIEITDDRGTHVINGRDLQVSELEDTQGRRFFQIVAFSREENTGAATRQ